MRSLLFVLGLASTLFLAGCGTPPERRLEAPSLQVTKLTTATDAATLDLRFTNPNTVPLVIDHSEHTLYLGNDSIGRINDKQPIGLPPLGSVTHTVTLNASLTAKARAYLAKNPGEVRAYVGSALELTTSDDDTITLKSSGTGIVRTK